MADRDAPPCSVSIMPESRSRASPTARTPLRADAQRLRRCQMSDLVPVVRQHQVPAANILDEGL